VTLTGHERMNRTACAGVLPAAKGAPRMVVQANSRWRAPRSTRDVVSGPEPIPMPLKCRRSSDPLQAIAGVGPSIARDLRALGIHRVTQLRNRDPERLYARINRLRGVRQDRCLLYVFRCAVYFASTQHPQPRLLRWWSWSDAARRTS
jgi:predicted flap endonuclease-1-like 5' DNA nuclease